MNENKELLTQIALSYYEYQQTQEEIAKQFNLSRIKVGRLLKQAREEGIVEINVKYHPVLSNNLEKKLMDAFGLGRALIAVDSPDDKEQRQLISSLVINFLSHQLQENMTIAVGQGRNVAAVANHIGVFPEKRCKFISAIGGTLRNGENIDSDHISRNLAKKFNGVSETLYAPAYVETAQLKQAILANKIVQETYKKAALADFALLGIDDMNKDGHMVQLGWFTSDEITKTSQEHGMVGEICGSFFNEKGQFIKTIMDDRVIGLSSAELKKIPCVIAIVSEQRKSDAIFGALKTGVINVLATSLTNAQTVLKKVKNESHI